MLVDGKHDEGVEGLCGDVLLTDELHDPVRDVKHAFRQCRADDGDEPVEARHAEVVRDGLDRALEDEERVTKFSDAETSRSTVVKTVALNVWSIQSERMVWWRMSTVG